MCGCFSRLEQSVNVTLSPPRELKYKIWNVYCNMKCISSFQNHSNKLKSELSKRSNDPPRFSGEGGCCCFMLRNRKLPSISICYDRKLAERPVFVKRRSADAQWHSCDVPGVSADEPRQASKSTASFRPADNTSTGLEDWLCVPAIKHTTSLKREELIVLRLWPVIRLKKKKENIGLWALVLTGLPRPPSFCTPTNTDASWHLYPGSALWFHHIHHIQCSHVRRKHTALLFQIKQQHFHSSTVFPYACFVFLSHTNTRTPFFLPGH